MFGDFCRGVSADRGALGRARAQPDRPQAARSRSCPRSARTRAGASTRSRSTGPSTASSSGDHAPSARRNPSPLTLSRDEHLGRRARPGLGGRSRGRRSTSHLDAVAAEVAARGGAGGIALTHGHADHSEARPGAARAARRRAAGLVRDAGRRRHLRAVRRRSRIPGHADDHLVFVAGRDAFTGDAVLGEGSVFVSGRLREYLDGLRRLRALDLEVICPGHGDVVADPAAKLDEYLAHRAERERKLLAALRGGARRARTSCSTPPGPTRPPRVRPRSRRIYAARAPARSCARKGGSRLSRSRPGLGEALAAELQRGGERRGAGGGGVVEDRAQRVADGADARARRGPGRSPRARARRRC